MKSGYLRIDVKPNFEYNGYLLSKCTKLSIIKHMNKYYIKRTRRDKLQAFDTVFGRSDNTMANSKLHDSLGIGWTIPLPTTPYQGRDFSDPAVVVRTVYEIDTRGHEKRICMAMFTELLGGIQDMPETLTKC